MNKTTALDYCRFALTQMGCFSAEEIDACLCAHNTVQRHLHPETQYNSCQQHSFSIVGFAKFARRNVLLRILKKMLRPRLLHCANTKLGQFEGYIIVRGSPELPAALEEFAQHLKHSVVITELENTMSLQTVACLDRIANGSRHFGNWLLNRNHVLRLQYSHIKRNLLERDASQRVLENTGMTLNAENLIALHTAYNNATMQLSLLQSRHDEARKELRYTLELSRDMLEIMRQSNMLTTSERVVTLANLQSMLASLVESIQVPVQLFELNT